MKHIVVILCLFPLLAFGQRNGRGGGGNGGNGGNNNGGDQADATTGATPAPSRVALWRCDLPGGSYEVVLRSIISISTHEYVVDGVARVNELNIETPGSVEVRFYYLEPITSSATLPIGQSILDRAKNLAEDAADRLTPGEEPPWEKVVKNYPTTTHAHTVEYRLESEDDVTNLFNSVDQAFRMNQNTIIDMDGGTGGGAAAGGAAAPAAGGATQ